MKKMKRILHSLALVAMGALALGGCQKERVAFSFTAELEQPEAYDNSKNYLFDEHFILWEKGDDFAVTANLKDTNVLRCSSSDVREATFSGETENNRIANASVLYAFMPAKVFDNEHSTSSEILINYPSQAPYRTDRDDRDFTFGKGAFPMVAYWNKEIMSCNCLGFHSVSGIVRVQIYSNLGAAAQVQSIEFTSITGGSVNAAQKVSGSFKVNGIETNTPYLTPNGDAEDGDYKISITDINENIGAGTSGHGTYNYDEPLPSEGQLLTFYLPLPAQSNGTGENKTTYALQMKVSSDKGSFTKSFAVDVRRNCITMMQAIEITQWDFNDVGPANVHLVGCGTKERPFQIYTYKELVMARDSCNATNGTINGQPITKDTWFKVCRSDIRLLPSKPDDPQYGNATHSQMNTQGLWEVGFQNFKGHFRCASNHAEQHGIRNESYHPLFESIDPQGQVDSVSVYGNIETGTAFDGDREFSPLCGTNNGTMRNCVNRVNISCKQTLAGVCLENNGTLNGCRNEGRLITSGAGKDVAGVVLTNNAGAKVRSCSALAKAVMSGRHVGGIVLENWGEVQVCYSNFNNAAAEGDLGGIVYANYAGGRVQGCNVSGDLTTRHDGDHAYSVGGICNLNEGTIAQCYSQMGNLAGSNRVGGIAATMTGGLVINCYLDGRGGNKVTSTTKRADVGGFVGHMSGGSIENGYNVFDTYLNTAANDGSTLGACVGTINGDVRIWNVYTAYLADFYGSRTGGTIEHCFARHAETGVALIDRNETTGVVTIHVEGNPAGGDLMAELDRVINDPAKHFHWHKGQQYPFLNTNHH